MKNMIDPQVEKMDNNYEERGYRGSSSKHASSYKIGGHERELRFANLINGTVKIGTQKRDVTGADGTKYSVKGGDKHWQIMLYSEGKFQEEEWGELGPLFTDIINCFPKKKEEYLKARENAKDKMYDYLSRESGKLIDQKYPMGKLENLFPDVNWKSHRDNLRNNQRLLKQIVGEDNLYLLPKFKLQPIARKMKAKFNEKGQIRNFLEKSVFENNEVDKLAIEENDNFLIFDKSDFLDIFENNLKPYNSIAGKGIYDINLDDQKTVLKGSVNYVELELRNDKSSYRNIRFNMKVKSTIKLLKNNTEEVKSPYKKIKYFRKKLLN